jgi:hypothetical protein
MNPRKLGPTGFNLLAKALGGSGSPFNWAALMKLGRVTRLDCCIDLVGVHIAEIMVWHKEQGKRSIWTGTDGNLESLYVFKRKVPLTSPPVAGKKRRAHSSLVYLYDRVRERISVLKKPPFGASPVTRIEVSKVQKSKSLASLPLVTNPFAGLRIGMISSQISHSHAIWPKFAGLRRSMGFGEACTTLGVADELVSIFAAAETVPFPDLVDPGEVWSHWGSGLKQAGLDL